MKSQSVKRERKSNNTKLVSKYEQSEQEISDDGEDLMLKAKNYSYEESEQETIESEQEESIESNEQVSDDDSIKEEFEEEEIKGNKKKSKKSLYSLPQVGEVAELLNIEEQFGSSLHKLQLDEIINKNVVKFGSLIELEEILREIKNLMENLPETLELSLNEAKKMMEKENIKIPFPEPHPDIDTKLKFSFIKPSKVHLIGSYPLNTLVKIPDQDITVELSVEMPDSLFLEKDYLNLRYFYKRSFYLAYLAKFFKDYNKFKVDYFLMDNEYRKPGLNLKFNQFNIRLLPCISAHVFKSTRFNPSKNNVRLNQVDVQEPPTPLYNTLLVRDTLYLSHMTFLHQNSTNCKGFSKCIILIKLWLYSHGFKSYCKSFNGFTCSLILAHLLATKKLSYNLSYWQLFKGWMDFIVNHNFEKHPVVIGNVSDQENFSIEVFKKNFKIVIMDPTGYANLVPNLNLNEIAFIKNQVQLSMKMIQQNITTLIDDLFLNNLRSPYLKFDNVFSFKFNNKLPNSWFTKVDELDNNNALLHLTNYLPKFLKEALGDRVTMIATSFKDYENFSLDKELNLNDLINKEIQIGLNLHNENSKRMVERGPSPLDKIKSNRFRYIWGKKSEIRKFQDGSIVESVVFDIHHIEDRRLIVQYMIEYLFKLHLKISNLNYWSGQLFQFIRLNQNNLRAQNSLENTKKGFLPILEAFDNLVQFVKQIEGIPLYCSKVLKLSSELRYTSLFVPEAIDDLEHFNQLPFNLRYNQPVEILLYYEESHHWPQDLQAIQNIKAALLLKYQQEFNSNNNLSSIQFQSRKLDVANFYRDTYLDVNYNGFIFRLRIHCSKEYEILNNELDSSIGNKNNLNRIKYQTCLKHYIFKYKFLPILSNHIHSLCQAYPTLSFLIRIVKRWISSHLLSDHVSDELIELLCAYIYNNPLPFTIPNSIASAFSRILNLLAKNDFNYHPLKFSFDSEENNSISTISSKHKSKVQLIYLDDDEFNQMEILSIDKHVLSRIKKLAHASLNCIDNYLQFGKQQDLIKMFLSPTNHLDAILKLDTNLVANYFMNYKPHLNNYKQTDLNLNGDLYKLDFNPVFSYLEELKNKYTNIEFFYDKYGGDKIGLIFKKINSVQFKLSNEYPVFPKDYFKQGELEMQVDYDILLNEIVRLGQGLVVDVIRK